MLHDFYIPGDAPERQHMRFRHYELRRRERIDTVLAERARIIQEVLDDDSVQDSVRSTGKADMLRRVVSREAARLESMVRKQIKRKVYIDKERKQKAEKASALEEKLRKLQEKRAKREALRQERAIEVQSINMARFQVRDMLLEKTRDEFQHRQSVLRDKQAAEAAKLEQFEMEKSLRESAYSEAYEAKQREIADRIVSQQIDLEHKKEYLYIKMEERAAAAREKKQQLVRLQQLKGEETNIRLLDALEKKRELERREAEKREQIAAFIAADTQSAYAYEYTRDEIVNQRKVLATKQRDESLDSFDDVLHVSPGPAEYAPAYSAVSEVPGPKISIVKPKLDLPGTVDFAATHALAVPGPGQYDSTVLADGSKLRGETSAIWSTGKKTNFIDETQRMRRDIPGPASYDVASDQEHLGAPLLRRNIVSPNLLDWRAHEASPGPAQYTVDEFTRREQLLKSIKHSPVIQS